MSQNFSINGVMQVDQPIGEIDGDFWSNILTAALYDPRRVLEKDVDAAIVGYVGDSPDIFQGGLEDDEDDNDEEFDDEADESFDEAEDDVDRDENKSTVSLMLDVTLSGGYGLEEYIDDACKVVYRAGVEKGIKTALKVEHTWLDRGPDDSTTMKWREMVAKFGPSV